MISAESMQNVDIAFHRAIKASLVQQPGDACEIAPIAREEWLKCPGQKLLSITISSFVFRMMIILRAVESAGIRAYYLPAGTTLTLDDVFREAANICGGTLNRELSGNFPHLAMSTPDVLNDNCVEFLGDLRPQHISRYCITINDSVRLQALLCLCCSKPIEVAAARLSAETEEDFGELELL